MTRVLFLTESFHPTLGGGEGHIRALASRLVALGEPCTVVTRRAEPDWSRVDDVDGIRVLRVGSPGPGRTGKFRMVPSALLALLRERRRFDVLVVRGTRVLGLPGLLAARLLGKPVVLQPELLGEMSGRVYTWGKPIEESPWVHLVRVAVRIRNAWLADAEAFVAMSREIAEELAQAGAGARTVLLPHGVDLSRFLPPAPERRAAERRRLGLPDDAYVIAYVGRLLRGKGLETLLAAFSGVAQRDARARLLLVGSGAGVSLSVEDDLRRAVGEGGLADRVQFTGRVDDVEAHLAAADVFAFPSEFEALGIALVEAAACGLPAAASRTGGIVDVVEDGRSGLLVPPGDSTALAEALERLRDAELRRRMGERASRVARSRFDLAASVVRYRALFRELARPRAS